MTKFRNLVSLFIFPPRRQFSWRAFIILSILYFMGNLAGIPLQWRSGIPIEPVWYWGVVTLVSTAIIALGLFLASRTGFGTPLLENRLHKREKREWLKSGTALTILLLVASTPLILLVNYQANSANYSFSWAFLPASFKAGVVEETGYRFFLVSLLVWLGGLFKRDQEGRPLKWTVWGAIILAGLIFGWAHVDARLDLETGSFRIYSLIMVTNSGLGVAFGWFIWKLGLEWAIIAHFAFDAYSSMILLPIYVSKNPVAWAILVVVLLAASIISWRALNKEKIPMEIT